jgi:hypothetical protein
MTPEEMVASFLEHYGVKGMHWGIRRSGTRGSTPPSKHPPTVDAQNRDASIAKVKTGGTHALSTKELQDLVQRMNLEQQYSKLSADSTKIDKGHSTVKKILNLAKTGSEVYNTVNSPAGKALKKLLTA